MSGRQLVDPDSPDPVKFPNFRKVRPTYEFTIAAGDTVFIPHGWFHHLTTDTDSISLTWNFVHETTRDALMTWLASELSQTDLDIVRFLLTELVGPTASAAEICTAIRSTRSSEREGFSRAIGRRYPRHADRSDRAGHRGSRARFPLTSRAIASVVKRVRKRTVPAAADSPPTVEDPVG